jgi:hypothetical protein
MDMRGTESQPALVTPAAAAEYWIDAWQRSILFLDVMRQRAVQNEEHAAELAPHVLDYEAELVVDGRSLDRPVNYLLVRIVPPAGVAITRGGAPSSSSTRAPATAPASAASRPTARSASR